MLSAKDVLNTSPIIPVVMIDDASKAVNIAHALQEGGIKIMEITLRSEDALQSIANVAKECPEMLVGAGTVISKKQFEDVETAGAKFVISPGMTQDLLSFAVKQTIPFIPGVATVSDIMRGLEYGLDTFKLFPANIVGGVGALKAFSGPFSNVSFCPTGGINIENVNDYLSLKNVLCVGGTWICPSKYIENDDYSSITHLCKEALKKVQEVKNG